MPVGYLTEAGVVSCTTEPSQNASARPHAGCNLPSACMLGGPAAAPPAMPIWHTSELKPVKSLPGRASTAL